MSTVTYSSRTRPSKRPLSNLENDPAPSRPLKRLKPSTPIHPKATTTTQKTLTQLHFNIDQTVFRTCSLCDLSYTKGAPQDEALHRAHCSRVRQGLEWGRDEERDRIRHGASVVLQVASDVKLKNTKRRGRVICFPADIGGKIGTKV